MAVIYRCLSLKTKWKDTFLSETCMNFLSEDVCPKLEGKFRTMANFSNVLELSVLLGLGFSFLP